ncbi:DUF4198 domain-containing protein [Pusillimonas noertemannii]|uniref:DUF4198 domain-containing protein n=1 Tax=Pusillimonas noertemannii TaxID=305977 RepID=UPI003340182B
MQQLIRTLSLSILASAAVALPAAQAHDAWPVAQEGGYAVVYGHQGKQENYVNDKVRQVAAFDVQGQALQAARQDTDKGVRFTVQGEPAVLTLEFDNGYWSKTTKGSVNLPKNEAEGALSGAHVVKFSKTVLQFSPAAATARGQRLEILPLSARAPKAGDALPVQVLWDGKPLPDAKLMRGHDDEQPVSTNAQGKASLPVESGRQAWSVMHKQALQGDSKADEYSASANLIFQVQ